MVKKFISKTGLYPFDTFTATHIHSRPAISRRQIFLQTAGFLDTGLVQGWLPTVNKTEKNIFTKNV
jgi:hypothetical protein